MTEKWASTSGAPLEPPPFLTKTYDIVEDTGTNDIISWSKDGSSFIVWKPAEFARDLLPKHFKHNNFSSFVRQLNTYGFRKVDPDKWEFSNDNFKRHVKELLVNIHRRKPGKTKENGGHVQKSHALIEVGQFGIAEEVEQIKRDKEVLMMELVRLRQRQQVMDKEMHDIKGVLAKQQNQQDQMMSLIRQALHDPNLFHQFVLRNQYGGPYIEGPDSLKRKKAKQSDDIDTKSLQIIKPQELPPYNDPYYQMQSLNLDDLDNLESDPLLEPVDNFLN